MILIIGASGQVGTELVKQLQTQQADFQALVHSPTSAQKLEAQGVKTVQADYTQPAELEAALAGVKQLFLLTPGSLQQAQIEQSVIDTAKKAGVNKIVKLSVFGADSEPDMFLLQQHAQVDQYLQGSGLDYVILRPNSFMQNFVRSNAATIKGQSSIYAPVGDGKVSHIDAADIAEVASIALTDNAHNGNIFTLTGPEALSYQEVAQKFSEHLGKPVAYVNLPDQAMHEAMTSNGVPAWYADGLIKLYNLYKGGKGATVTADVEQITGHPSRSLDAFIAANLAAFR